MPGRVLDDGECEAVPLRTLSGPGRTARTYLNQRDNRSVGLTRLGTLVSPDAQCAATSLTMSLLSLYDGDRAAFLDECASLARQQGRPLQDPSEDDVELAVMDLILHTDWGRAFTSARAFFEGPTWRKWHPGNRVIKNPFAQAYTASRFSRCGDHGVSIVSQAVCIERGRVRQGMDFARRWSWAQQMWQSGAELSFEGNFTQSGHVVHVLELAANSMVIHDPFGMCLTQNVYLSNGKAPRPLSTELQKVLARRVQHNPSLKSALATNQPYFRWGERNAYSRAELSGKLGALKWVLAIGTDTPAMV